MMRWQLDALVLTLGMAMMPLLVIAVAILSSMTECRYGKQQWDLLTCSSAASNGF